MNKSLLRLAYHRASTLFCQGRQVVAQLRRRINANTVQMTIENNMYMKTFILESVLIGLIMICGVNSYGQTNPTVQNLPYTDDFSTLMHSSTTYPAGWQGWTVSSSPGNAFNTSAPIADRLLVANSTASTNSGNVHNYNGKFGFLNTGSLDLGLVLGLNTTGASNVDFSYEIMTIRNPFDGGANTRINEVVLQYRIGTAGSFTNISGTTYQNNTTTQTTAVTTPQNPQTINITLPSACDNEPVVQLRIVSRQVSGGGARPSFAIDNVSALVSSSCSAPSSQASNINFGNVTSNGMEVNWTNGNGDGRVVIMNTTNSFTAPTNGSTPSANTNYSGSGEQVVYSGSGSGPISISGLTPGQVYWYRIYEYCAPDVTYQTSTAANNPNAQVTICNSITNYFRSVGTGNWNNVNTWESSVDEISWATPSCPPDFNANTIRIRNGHVVTVDEAVEVDQIIIENGGVLRKIGGADMTLRDGTGDDIRIQMGGFLEYAGSNVPNYENLSVRIRVHTGGTIRVLNNVSGISSNLAGNGSSNRIIYEHGSIFEWSAGTALASSDQVYFPDVDQNTIPTFRLMTNTGNTGATNPTSFNGIFEANGNITFVGCGDKNFRNGIIGSGNVTQAVVTSCTGSANRFYFTGPTAFLGGTGELNLNGDRLNTANDVTLMLISHKIINTSSINPNDGQLRMTNGSTLNMDAYELLGSGNIRLNEDVTIITLHPNGLDGALGGLAASDFVSPQNQSIEFNALGTQNSGSSLLPSECANLTAGSGTTLTLQADIDVKNELRLNSGAIIHVASGQTLHVSNSDEAAIVGGLLSGGSNYISGQLLWSTNNGSYAFPTGATAHGAQGFTISVTGSGDVLGYLEANSTTPLQSYAYCDLGTPTASGQQVGQGTAALDGILDQVELNLASLLQWNITNPDGGVTAYDLTVNANGSNDISPVVAATGVPIRFLMKNGEPGNAGVATGNTPEFPPMGFLTCPNGYTLTGMTSFSTFTINGSSAPNTALPVEFLFFTASLNNQNEVVLNWATASELNNDFFTVERSVDGLTWEVVEIVNGNGTTPLRNDYSANDPRPYSGLSYYRLKQTDFDGAFEFADIVSIFINGEDKSLIKIVNLIGQEVDLNTRGMVILIFSDGSTQKVINE